MHIVHFHRIRPSINVNILQEGRVWQTTKMVLGEDMDCSICSGSHESVNREVNLWPELPQLVSSRAQTRQALFPQHKSERASWFPSLPICPSVKTWASIPLTTRKVCDFSLSNNHFPLFLWIQTPNLTLVKHLHPHPGHIHLGSFMQWWPCGPR